MVKKQEKLKPEENEKRNLLKKTKPYVYEKIMKFDEKIKKGESVAIVRVEYDYTCNFNCQHCCIRGFQGEKNKNKRAFTPADIRELSRQADAMGLAHFVITGGEPLVFPDFDEIVKAIDPQKFYITSDTNGWFLDEKRAKHLKSIGVDKIQLSLDNLIADEHDAFRRKKGSHARAMRAIDAAKKAGLNIIIQTVVWKQRVRSQELIDFLEFGKKIGVGIYISYAKPVGAWEGNFGVLCSKDDMDYVRKLEKKYNVFTHLTPSYGHNFGCIAVKRMISITKYGDIMPCPYIHISLGNFFKEPLKNIIERGMNIKWFAKHTDLCISAVDRKFISEVEAKKIYGKKPPVPYSQVFTKIDFLR
jgi:MoaA/NifB/PqqE/SkfB family radical SAM enzyme